MMFELQRWKQYCLACFLVHIFVFSLSTGFAQQQGGPLEQRVQAIENYLETIQPSFQEFSDNLQDSIQRYSQGLDESLIQYTQDLQEQLESRFRGLDRRTVVLNPVSKAYQPIDTNTGTFLIAIDKLEPIEEGYRLHLNIGNPNFADYRNFTLRLFWGRKWNPNTKMTYQQWQQSLQGIDYTFQGKIAKGQWNPVKVDLVPAEKGQISHIECSMEVSSIELQPNSP